MKIAFILSQCRFAGSSKNVLEVGKYLSDWGHDIHIFANSCDPVSENIKFHRIPAIGSNYVIRESMTTALETVAMKMRRFDVTVSQPSRYFSPKICHVRFLNKANADVMNKTEKTDLSTKMACLIEEFNLRKSKHIITMSNSVKNDIIKHYAIESEKISVVYDGVDMSKFNRGEEEAFRSAIRKKHGIGKDNFLFLFAGNPFSRKGLEYLIEALPKINENAKLVIIGKGDTTEYARLADDLGVGNRLVFAGFTNEIHKYFAAADLFVLPTLYEPFGLVITEAMASGLPVVTSASAGAAELIENGVDGLLLDDPTDYAAIADCINRVIDENLFRKFGDAAKKKVEQYTWERTAKDMLTVFEKVIGDKK